LSEAASTIFLLTPGYQAADHLLCRLVFSDPLNRWVEADLEWREQGNALIESNLCGQRSISDGKTLITIEDGF
jgi:hypothetical protein